MSDPLVGIVYGSAFCGKTTMIADLTNHGKRVHFLDWDINYSGIPQGALESNYHRHKFIPSMDKSKLLRSFLKIFEGAPCVLCHKHGFLACKLCSEDQKYKLDASKMDTDDILIVDSATEVSAYMMDFCLGFPGPLDREKPTFHNFRKQGDMIKWMFSAARMLPCHVIFVAHEQEKGHKDKDADEFILDKILPTIGSSTVSELISSKTGFTVEMNTSGKKRRIMCDTLASTLHHAGNTKGLKLTDPKDFYKLFE